MTIHDQDCLTFYCYECGHLIWIWRSDTLVHSAVYVLGVGLFTTVINSLSC